MKDKIKLRWKIYTPHIQNRKHLFWHLASLVSVLEFLIVIRKIDYYVSLTCIYSYLYIFLPVYIPTCIYFYLYIFLPVYIPTCIYSYLYIFLPVYSYLYIFLPVYILTCIYSYLYIFLPVYILTCIYSYLYIFLPVYIPLILNSHYVVRKHMLPLPFSRYKAFKM
jgi:hypothetical protein